jgi:hypothetical protein
MILSALPMILIVLFLKICTPGVLLKYADPHFGGSV